MKPVVLATWFHPGFLVGLFFDTVDGADMYLRNVSSGSKNSPSMKPVVLATWFHAGFLVGLFFNPEGRGDMYLWNVGSGSKNNPSMKPVLLVTSFHAGFLLGLFLNLNMEMTCSSKTPVGFQWTARWYTYIPENRTLHNHSYENLHTFLFYGTWNLIVVFIVDPIPS
jgi:hypothetical protein